jgi:MarR family transcriptional repressor of emrRAB
MQFMNLLRFQLNLVASPWLIGCGTALAAVAMGYGMTVWLAMRGSPLNARIKPSEKMQRPAGLRFSVVERRLEAIRKRIPGYAAELATLGRLIIDIEKRQNDLCNAALKAYELNFVEYNALMALHVSGSDAVTASELSAATGEKPANITRICDSLLRQKLIDRTRHPVDRRRVVVQLTPKATRLLDELQPTLWVTMRNIYGSLNQEEVRRVTELLQRPLAALES